VLDFEFGVHWMFCVGFCLWCTPDVVCWIFSLLYTGRCFFSLLYPECCLLDFEFALYRIFLSLLYPVCCVGF
jgi:hypothetical protein